MPKLEKGTSTARKVNQPAKEMRKRKRSPEQTKKRNDLSQKPPSPKSGYKFDRGSDRRTEKALSYPAMDRMSDNPEDASDSGMDAEELNRRRLHRLGRSKVSEMG